MRDSHCLQMRGPDPARHHCRKCGHAVCHRHQVPGGRVGRVLFPVQPQPHDCRGTDRSLCQARRTYAQGLYHQGCSPRGIQVVRGIFSTLCSQTNPEYCQLTIKILPLFLSKLISYLSQIHICVPYHLDTHDSIVLRHFLRESFHIESSQSTHL